MNRHRILLAIALMIGATALIVPRLRREPVADGKPISYWLENLGYYDADDPNEAAMALRKIGTNALPRMLAEIKRNKSKTKEWLENQLTRQSLVKFKFEDEGEHRGHAEVAFEILGSAAAPAIPDLMRVLAAEEVNDEVEEALALIGVSSISPLINALTNANPFLRQNAADTLKRIGAEAVSAVPTLLRCLHDSNANVRESAASALGGIRSMPEQVVPALITALQDSERDVRFEAVYALGCFEGDAEAAIGPLLKLLPDRQADVREQVAVALGQIARNSEVVVPDLLLNLRNADVSVRASIIGSLSNFPDKADEIVPVLMKQAEDTSSGVSSSALDSLGRLKSKPKEVVPFLISRLQDPSPFIRFDAALALGEFGDSSEQTVRALERLLADKTLVFRGSMEGSVPVSGAAQGALMRIQSQPSASNRSQ